MHFKGGSMRIETRFKIALACLVVLVPGLNVSQAADVTIYDSLTPGLAGGQTQGQASIDPGGTLVAQGFSTTVSEFVINSISLQIYKQPGSTDVYSVWIYDNVGGLPNTVVASVALNQSQAALSDSASTKSFGTLGLTLSASTNYFLVVGGVQSTSMNWDYWDTATPSGIGIPSLGTSFDGTNWTATALNYPAMMSIAASVPEPSTWAMASLTVAVLAGAARRKKAQARLAIKATA